MRATAEFKEVKRLEHRVSELETMLQELESERANDTAKLAALKEVNTTQTQQVQELESQKGQLERTVGDMQTEHEAAIAAVKQGLQLRERNSEQALAQMAQQHASVLQATEQAHASVLQCKEAELAQALAAAQQEHEAALQALLQTKDAELDAALAAERAARADAVREARQQAETDVRETMGRTMEAQLKLQGEAAVVDQKAQEAADKVAKDRQELAAVNEDREAAALAGKGAEVEKDTVVAAQKRI